MHLSTGEQVAETAAKYFTGQAGLVLLALDAQVLGPALKWEPSRNDALFPHLYRPLRYEEVLWAEELPLVEGRHVFPAERMA